MVEMLYVLNYSLGKFIISDDCTFDPESAKEVYIKDFPLSSSIRIELGNSIFAEKLLTNLKMLGYDISDNCTVVFCDKTSSVLTDDANIIPCSYKGRIVQVQQCDLYGNPYPSKPELYVQCDYDCKCDLSRLYPITNPMGSLENVVNQMVDGDVIDSGCSNINFAGVEQGLGQEYYGTHYEIRNNEMITPAVIVPRNVANEQPNTNNTENNKHSMFDLFKQSKIEGSFNIGPFKINGTIGF
jgi:hypothetical protein